MTNISAKIIADSVSPDGVRLTTMQLRYPRCIHAEFMTHRMFSRNASSSRAIPVERLIQDVLDDPFVPLHWGKNQPGMQAREECDALIPNGLLTGEDTPTSRSRESAWLYARNEAVNVAYAFHTAGYHKQVVNRLLEPWAHINVVVTATEWTNFFGLRDHPDAEPHIAILAREMKAAMDWSSPTLLDRRPLWHLPYVTVADCAALDRRHEGSYICDVALADPIANEMNQNPVLRDAIKLSVARCARVSYLTQDGKQPSIEADLALYDRLVGGVPLHASPTEHQATPGERDVFSGNLRGWVQFRKTLPNENIQ